MNISKKIIVQSSIRKISQCRAYATQVSPQKPTLSYEEDWKAAKPFEKIPKLSAFTFIRRMIPGGKSKKRHINQ